MIGQPTLVWLQDFIVLNYHNAGWKTQQAVSGIPRDRIPRESPGNPQGQDQVPVLAGLQEFSGYGTWSWTFEFRVESPVHSWQFNQVNGGDWVGIEFNDRGRFSLSDGALFTTVTLPDTLGAPATVRAGGIELDQVSPGQSLTFADFCSQLGHELLSDEGSFGIAEFELILGTAPTSEQCGARLTLAVRLDYSRAQTSPAVALEFGNPWFFPDGFEGP